MLPRCCHGLGEKTGEQPRAGRRRLELGLLVIELGVEDTLAEAVRLRAELADVPAAIDVIGG